MYKCWLEVVLACFLLITSLNASPVVTQSHRQQHQGRQRRHAKETKVLSLPRNFCNVLWTRLESDETPMTFDRLMGSQHVLKKLCMRNGETPLLRSIILSKPAWTSYLIEHGSDVEFIPRDSEDGTALHRVVEKGWLDQTRQLLDRDADPNAWNNNETKMTPLHVAARNDRVEIAKLLIERGSYVNMRDADGWTPLHYSSVHRLGDMIEVLRSLGARNNVLDSRQWTPVDYATDEVTRALLTLPLDLY